MIQPRKFNQEMYFHHMLFQALFATYCKQMEWDKPLSEFDPELQNLIDQELRRQITGIELIASENFTSRAVLDCLGTCLTNKYSEGLPFKRYYGGNEYIDEIETLCQQRALEAFGLDPNEWGVNVQPYSGSPANFEVYTALLKPHERIMGLGLPSGGHLTHGFYTAKKRISASSIYFESLPYGLDANTGYIDYQDLERQAKLFLPKLIIAGASAYPRDYDYAAFRRIADEVGAFFMTDMAHYSGLVASKIVANPFEFSDIVTTTTHKTLRGPRGALIFYKKQFEEAINGAVFPACQGGPHNNNVAGIATQLKQVMTDDYRQYCRAVVDNMKALCEELVGNGYSLVSNGSDNHLCLWDLRPQKLTGNKLSLVCDAVKITINKNSVPGDKSAVIPGGVRIGSPAMTSRGAGVEDFRQIARFLHRAVQISLSIQERVGAKLADFQAALASDEQIVALKAEVEQFAGQFAMPGVRNQK